MGLYITGNFEPPKASYKALHLWADGSAYYLTEDGMVTATWTLVPDHGDLIDRDALRQEMRLSDSCSRCERDAYRCQYYDEMTVMDVCGRIDDMPVVIPAERSEECEKR